MSCSGRRYVNFPIKQGCGNNMPDLSDLAPFHSVQVENSIYFSSTNVLS